MKEFISILISFIFMSIADNIDSAFNNYISVDAIVVSLNFIFSFIYLFISHGSVPIAECFPYFLFYIISVFGLYQYETYKTLCITQGKSFVLLIGSTIGVVIRLLLCLLFLNTSYSLFVFGLTNFIDFYARGFIYKIILSKLYNNKYEYLNA